MGGSDLALGHTRELHDRPFRWAMFFVATAIAGVWIGILALIEYIGPSLEPVLLTNGWVVATYGTIFAIARCDRLKLLVALTVGLLGLTHMVWMLIAGSILEYIGVGRTAPLPEIAIMLLVTGAGFGVPLGLATRDWRCFIPIALATAVSLALQITPGLPPWCRELTLGCMVLHAGIASGLGWSTAQTIRLPDSELGVTVCLCGYNLRGLPKPICPECGRVIAGPPLNLPRLDQV